MYSLFASKRLDRTVQLLYSRVLAPMHSLAPLVAWHAFQCWHAQLHLSWRALSVLACGKLTWQPV